MCAKTKSGIVLYFVDVFLVKLGSVFRHVKKISRIEGDSGIVREVTRASSAVNVRSIVQWSRCNSHHFT